MCRGQPGVRVDVRHLLCLLTKDNPVSTEELNTLLTHRIVMAIKGHLSNQDFVSELAVTPGNVNSFIPEYPMRKFPSWMLKAYINENIVKPLFDVDLFVGSLSET